MVSEAMVDGLSIAGSPQRCREKLAALIDAGITTAVFATEGGPDFAKNLEWLHRNLIRDFIWEWIDRGSLLCHNGTHCNSH